MTVQEFSAQSRSKILVVEDTPEDELMLLRILPNEGVHVVRDGATALDYLFGQGGHHAKKYPSLILLDMDLPQIHGLEVLKRIKQHEVTRRIPVVLMTNSNSQLLIFEGLRNGAEACFTKPITRPQIEQIIAMAMQL